MTANKSAPDIITLKIVSDPKNISLLGEAIHALCLYATKNEACAYDVQLAVVEALNNVILHAYKNQAGNDIIVQWGQTTGCLSVEIIDFGISMSSIPPGTIPEFEAESGRGWWIINACIDEYYYKVVEFIERERGCTPSPKDEAFDAISVTSSKNTLTLIKHY
jgi:serine/threonine-protein kinase RsbW